MLSRHFLRAKALQTLYAATVNSINTREEVEKNFDINVSRLNSLGLFQLSTLSQLAFTAERIMEMESQKFNPQESDIKMLQRFADNRLIKALDESFEYKQLIQKTHIDWSDNFDVFRKVTNTLKSSHQYADYMKIECPTFNDDKDIAVVAFKYLMNEDNLRDIIFDHDLLWEDDFDQVAQYVYMMLKELKEEECNEGMPCPQVYDRRNEKELNDYLFARELAAYTFIHLDDVEPMIRKHLQNWEFERVALMDVLLINMAVTEFTHCPSIPERVTVDEYIELSKEFSTEKSKLFVNGILDKLLIELRASGKVVKDERGMYDPEIDNEPQD